MPGWRRQSETAVNTAWRRLDQVFRQQALDLGADSISRVLPSGETVHRNDATGIHGVIRDIEGLWQGRVVAGREKGGKIIGHNGRCMTGQLARDVVRFLLAAPEIEPVADARSAHTAGGFRHSFENEGMETVAGVWIAVGEHLVAQHGQTKMVGQVDGGGQRVVGFNAAVGLQPVEHIMR